jgi:hypothetical protein
MTNEDIIRLAIEHTINGLKFNEDGLLRFANLVAQHEREACAKLCFEMWEKWMDADPSERDNLPRDAEDCANAIRARGQA